MDNEVDVAHGVSTLVTSRLRSAVGVWGDWSNPSFPVDRSDIRRWAIATYWPSLPPRVFWDEAYAQNTSWGGIIAPPEFNPFAWPVVPVSNGIEPYQPRPDEPGQNLLNGGQEAIFVTPIRPGDVIRARKRVREFEEREGRFGITLYVYVERELRNQHDQVVRLTTDTIIRH